MFFSFFLCGIGCVFCYYYLLPRPSWLFFWWFMCGGGNHGDDGCGNGGNGHGKGGHGHNDDSYHYAIHYFSPSFATLHNLGYVFCLLLSRSWSYFFVLCFVALVVVFSYCFWWRWLCFLWPWLCSFHGLGLYSLVVVLHNLGLVIFLMLFVMVWSCFSFVALGGLGCVLPALLFGALVMFFSHCSSWPWSCFSLTTLYGLGYVLLLLFWIVFYCYYLWPWLCSYSESFFVALVVLFLCKPICCVWLCFFLLILVMFFYYCFWLCSFVVFIGHVFLLLPWLWFFTTNFYGLYHVLLMFLFLDLALLNEFSRDIHGRGDEFSKANNVLNKSCTRNGLLCFYFWF